MTWGPHVRRVRPEYSHTTRRPKTYYMNMTIEKAREIRRAYFAREANQRELAERYGIRQNTVSRIVSCLVWNG